jgi:two-component system, cell cycle response regulator
MTQELTAGRPRILLMDTDQSGAAKICAQLTMAGLCPLRAVDEMEALATVKNQGVDLAVLHLSADYIADTDMAQVLRAVADAAYLPVIVVAGEEMEGKRCLLLDTGADDVVDRSTSGDELVSRVRALLRVKLLHDELAASRGALQDALRRERNLLAKLRNDYNHLVDLATTDPLTHVQNVRSFQEILEHEFKVARRYNHPLSLLMLDVDHFKVVNDTHGHPSGDYVLKELAVILKNSVRDSDVVARTGGEEFSVILPKADRSQAMQFAERIRTETSDRRFVVYGKEIHVTISIGYATYPADAEITDQDMLVYFADQALLHAKESGRDRVVPFGQLDLVVRQRLRRQQLQMKRGKQQEGQPCEHATETDILNTH